MFNKKNLKLICTAIGLVAVLVLGLAMPGATQQAPMPTREQIVQGLNQLVSATLTASEGDILDLDNLVFYSHPEFTAGYIPLHGSSRSVQLLYKWLTEEEPFGDSLNLGSFYTEKFLPCQQGYDSLKAGVYNLRVNKDLKLIAVDPEGNEYTIGYMKRIPRVPSLNTQADLVPPWVGALAICAATAVAGRNLCLTIKICTPLGCLETTQCIGCA